ncbi:MAG: 1-(5-phosphoribosyl)-5-[(5-phosphoribosylamino)methylideneamino] imidazole-4-carboxamide isomerase [Chloroflexi bacterium]|jgi:phosphoribosylformimino-5-aminoimidazole carboxamide ribotide isomerase|nr:1-(5-phosphoribosyl)-5-[(5-phosphoribosylamino)methylideneamino] imidazole-4-carboxamide isomerase [Chloroflexota bacterium]
MTEGKPTNQGSFELLPAVDLHGGAVVRLVRGDFRQATAYPGDPVAIAAGFVRAGARWLHVVDLDGARDPGTRQVELIRAIVTGMGESARVEVAGGLRDDDSVAAMLDAGAARVVVGTAALQDPEFVRRLVDRHGPDRVAVALDVRERLAIGHGWAPGSAGMPVEDAVTALADAGVETFEVTAIERDGTMAGPDLALLERAVAMRRGAVIASAGIATTNDLRAARALGCAGAIVGRALYEGRFTLAEALRSLEA